MVEIKERGIEKYLVARVKALGGFSRKLQWIGVNGAPDRIVFLNGVHFVELKAPGKRPSVRQLVEHRLMENQGVKVHIIDSLAGVDEFCWNIHGYI